MIREDAGCGIVLRSFREFKIPREEPPALKTDFVDIFFAAIEQILLTD